MAAIVATMLMSGMGVVLGHSPAAANSPLAASATTTNVDFDNSTKTGTADITLSIQNQSGAALPYGFSVRAKPGKSQNTAESWIDVVQYDVVADLYDSTITNTVDGSPYGSTLFGANRSYPANTTYTVNVRVHYALNSLPPIDGLRIVFSVVDFNTGTTIDAESSIPPPDATSGWDPIGSIWIGPANFGFYLTGWAADGDTINLPNRPPTTAVIFIDGEFFAGYNAVDSKPGRMGEFFGMAAAPPGPHEVCIFVYNQGPGTNRLVECETVVVPNSGPRGEVATWTADGTIYSMGWVVDDDSIQQQIGIWFVVDGRVIYQFLTNQPSPYLHPYGVFGNHAFITAYKPPTKGKHEVCVMGLNVGYGTNQWLNCTTVTT